jgi:hypothetical protein
VPQVPVFGTCVLGLPVLSAEFAVLVGHALLHAKRRFYNISFSLNRKPPLSDAAPQKLFRVNLEENDRGKRIEPSTS